MEQPETQSAVGLTRLLADDLLSYINKTPEMLSMLYDLDMMPEQLTRESRDWYRMLILASWHRTKSEQSANSRI
jgi:hypothetical protein